MRKGMRVKEVADLVGISVRALHYYDEIGLLKPSAVSEAGYRLYLEEDLEKLQQILFFREMGFPLKQIKEIIHSPSFDRRAALELHRKMLLHKRNRLDQMLATVEKTIQHMEGGRQMSLKERFAGLDFSHNPYEQEARERWGDEAVDRANARLSRLGQEEQQAIAEKCDAIFRRLAALRHGLPSSSEAQDAIRQWYALIRENFWDCTPEAFRALGQMYVEDERFTASIDRYGEGLARFMRDAMAVFADRQADR